MSLEWGNNINQFISCCNTHDVQLILVGGSSVNFHGYQRHSADVDFWIKMTPENLDKLILAFREMGYDLDSFPEEIHEKKRNISVKFSPEDLDLELITNFSTSLTFEDALEQSVLVEIEGNQLQKWHVLSLEHLIDSKLKAGRHKDLLDVYELKKIHNLD